MTTKLGSLRLLLVLFFSFITLWSFAQAVSADVILGTWLTASGKAKVQIYKEGRKYFGKITWLKIPTNEDGTTRVDKNNPDLTMRQVPLMGLNMLKGFEFDEDEWENGTIYDPENGKTYSCFIKYRDGLLDLRGYLGLSIIGRTQTWFRIPDKK